MEIDCSPVHDDSYDDDDEEGEDDEQGNEENEGSEEDDVQESFEGEPRDNGHISSLSPPRHTLS
jgi:hypothetical protein